MEKLNGMSEKLTTSELLEMKTRLDDDLHHLLDAQETLNQRSDGGSAEDLAKRVASLRRQLVKESTARSWCELRLKRIEMGQLLCNKLFLEEDNASAVKNNLEKLDMAQQALRIDKETRDLEEKLHDQELNNFRLKTENMELLEKLKECQKQVTLPAEVIRTNEYKSLKTELDVQCKSITICQNVIQRLIYGLGINLDEDKELEELIEKCSETPTFR
ncbi:hypothetical protein EGW08_000094 [Elysia chlorotica]|uniref:Centromere protein H C-terminal domain-containing protein n=1 Tax=Elysia chlorotica TaxID=188477 RepID=A0A3S1BVC6_ELYCH|nr:hypothetical protein EGW08_000094 [Elysia chlorotica]